MTNHLDEFRLKAHYFLDESSDPTDALDNAYRMVYALFNYIRFNDFVSKDRQLLLDAIRVGIVRFHDNQRITNRFCSALTILHQQTNPSIRQKNTIYSLLDTIHTDSAVNAFGVFMSHEQDEKVRTRMLKIRDRIHADIDGNEVGQTKQTVTKKLSKQEWLAHEQKKPFMLPQRQVAFTKSVILATETHDPYVMETVLSGIFYTINKNRFESPEALDAFWDALIKLIYAYRGSSPDSHCQVDILSTLVLELVLIQKELLTPKNPQKTGDKNKGSTVESFSDLSKRIRVNITNSIVHKK